MATAVVTGCNRGIGLELCRKLKERGDHVIALCRHVSAELEQLDVQIKEGVDVRSEKSIAEVVHSLNGRDIDLLINNAGILHTETLEKMDFTAIREQFEVNALAPLMVSKAFVPLMNNHSKIAVITSRMGSIADNSSGGYYGYRMSKSALNMAAASLAIDLKPHGISVIILHPGYVRTDMTNQQGIIEADESAVGLIKQIDDLHIDTSGVFKHMTGEILPW